jgi:transposase-like protein
MAEYQIADRQDKRALTEFLRKEGQLLLPWVELFASSTRAVDELIDVTGRAAVEAVLKLSAQEVAGPKHPGQAGGEIRWHGEQDGVVPLAERKVRVRRPRLRHKHGGEVEIPAYAALRANSSLADRVLSILLRGVSTRAYHEVLPAMAESVGVSRSSVSREMIEASTQTLRVLTERRFDDLDILVVYLDGIRLGKYHVVVAVGVDRAGSKHVLGLVEGATENATVVTGLLADLVARGLRPDRHRLFVIDGAKALRTAIDAVFGTNNPVQRCRRHKERNVQGYLPKHEAQRVLKVLQAAFRLPADLGMAKLEKEAKALATTHPSAAASLREGLAEMFTVNRLGLPEPLQRGLNSTNVIESVFSGSRSKTRRVTHWQTGAMALRWAAAGLLETEKRFKKLMGYQYLGLLDQSLQQSKFGDQTVEERMVG